MRKKQLSSYLANSNAMEFDCGADGSLHLLGITYYDCQRSLPFNICINDIVASMKRTFILMHDMNVSTYIHV